MDFLMDLDDEPENNTVDILLKKTKKDTKLKTFNNKEFMDIELNKLKDNPFQPRKSYDTESIAELAASIKRDGIIQSIEVAKIDGSFIIIYGHRRVRACRVLGHKTIKAKITENVDNQELQVKSLIENLQRENMHPIETALAFQSALNSGSFKNQSDLAFAIGKDRSYVSKLLNILSLPKDILDEIIQENTISDIVIIGKLAKVENSAQCKELYEWYKKEKPSRSEFLKRAEEGVHKKSTLNKTIEAKIKQIKKIKYNELPKEKIEKIEKLMDSIVLLIEDETTDE